MTKPESDLREQRAIIATLITYGLAVAGSFVMIAVVVIGGFFMKGDLRSSITIALSFTPAALWGLGSLPWAIHSRIFTYHLIVAVFTSIIAALCWYEILTRF